MMSVRAGLVVGKRVAASSATDPFEVRGTVKVRDSATVICARRRPGPSQSLSPADVARAIGGDPQDPKHLQPFRAGDRGGIFGNSGQHTFNSGWEVLMGQAEVVNWLRTTPEKIRTMRYAGEWKLPGGNVDAGESIANAARRELTEEFLHPLGLNLPSNAVLRPFTVNQTKPIRSVSNLMHCYIALEDENPWLAAISIHDTNAALKERRRKFATMSLGKDGKPTASFWAKSHRERESVTPEVHQVAWVPLRDAVCNSLSSLDPLSRVNDYQRDEFARYGRTRRDPMFITAATLIELEAFPDAQAVIKHCHAFNTDEALEEVQWIFEGMDSRQVAEAKETRDGRRTVFKDPEQIAALRAKWNATRSSL